MVEIGPYFTKIYRNRTKIGSKLCRNRVGYKNQNLPFLTKMDILLPKLIRTSIRFENVKNLKIVYLSETKSFLDHFFPKKKKLLLDDEKKILPEKIFLLVFL